MLSRVLSRLVGFLVCGLFFFVLLPSPASAKMYSIDPVGLTIVTVENPFNDVIAQRALEKNNDQPIDLNSSAALQMHPRSDFLATLNQTIYTNQKFLAVYGNIDIVLSQSIFHFQLTTPEISIGDGLISSISASSIPSPNLTTREFSDETQRINGNILLVKKDKTYSYKIDTFGLDELRYLHSDLPIQLDVTNEVVQNLKSI